MKTFLSTLSVLLLLSLGLAGLSQARVINKKLIQKIGKTVYGDKDHNGRGRTYVEVTLEKRVFDAQVKLAARDTRTGATPRFKCIPINGAFVQSVTYRCATANDGITMRKGLRLHFRFEVKAKAGKNTQHQVKSLYVFFPKG